MIKEGINVETVRDGILNALFSSTNPSEFVFENIRLPSHTGKDIDAKKIGSIAKKYETNPPEFIDYYPRLPENIEKDRELDDDDLNVRQFTNSRKRHKGADKSDIKINKIVSAPKNFTVLKKARRFDAKTYTLFTSSL